MSPAAPPGARAGGPGLTAGVFDSHCHLDLLAAPVSQVLADARAAGIGRVVTVGYDTASSRWAAQCAAEHQDVYAAVAIHPNETSRSGEDALDAVAGLAGLPQVRAIGETGLDYYRTWSDPAVQQRWFRAHVRLAKDVAKPLVIHDRDAHDDVLRILAEEGPPAQVIFHCFSGDAAMVKTCADAGYFMSFAGNVTFPSAQPLREAARYVPLDLLLVETDAPYLTPVPHRGKPNSPAFVPYTLRCLAEVRGRDAGEIGAAIAATGQRLFGPW